MPLDSNNNPAAVVLVVDDNPAGRYATSRVLRAAGFSVREAATGNEGVELAPEADLIILDVHLPDVNGFEVCRRIRSDPRTARIPVIHLSATFVKDTDKVEGLDAGADGYLTHPVEPPVLIATANAFLRARRAEDEMRKSEAKFKAIFDHSLSGILLVSQDMVYLEANPAMCRLLGRTREEIVGKHNSSFVPSGYEEQTAQIAREVEERGTWRGTFPLIGADGRHVELEWSIARYSLPGVRLAIVNDVSQRRAYEMERDRLLAAEQAARTEAERANRIKDEFLATLSHELRTPLNAMLGWTQILTMQKPTPEDVAEGIEAIDRNAKSQAQLIDDLLDVSRITSGKLRLEVRSLNMCDVINSALESTRHAIEAKQIILQRYLDTSVGSVNGDPNRIQQVIWNLVNNAAKFTPRGGSIDVTLGRLNSSVEISVRDNGQGIKPDFLPHIFERFRQENATTKRNQGGLGLGLAICKHLVEMHGGTITAHSGGEGCGSTFTVLLPVAAVIQGRVDEPADIGTSIAGPAPEAVRRVIDALPSLDGVRVLVVDDEADARAVLHRVLLKSGAVVHEADSVRAALAELNAFDAQVLISDIGLPMRDGWDLIHAVRSGGKTAEALPAIALTAFARTEDQTRSLKSGFQLHLSKPVDAAELVAAVAHLADRETAPH